MKIYVWVIAYVGDDPEVVTVLSDRSEEAVLDAIARIAADDEIDADHLIARRLCIHPD